MSGNRCIYKGCSESEGEGPATFFSWLPWEEEERCKTWLRNSGNSDLLSAKKKELSKKCICSRHFPEEMIDPVTKSKLIPTAVPTPIPEVNPDEPGPSGDTPRRSQLSSTVSFESVDEPSEGSQGSQDTSSASSRKRSRSGSLSRSPSPTKEDMKAYVRLRTVENPPTPTIRSESLMSLRPRPEPDKVLIRGEARSGGKVQPQTSAGSAGSDTEEMEPPSSSLARRSSSPAAGSSTKRSEPPLLKQTLRKQQSSVDAEFRPTPFLDKRYAKAGPEHYDRTIYDTVSAPPAVSTTALRRLRSRQADSVDDTIASGSLPLDPSTPTFDPEASLSVQSSIATDSIDMPSPDDPSLDPSSVNRDQPMEN